MDHRIMVLETSTATVEEAAKVHGVDPDQIGRRGPECIHTIDNSGAEAVLKL